MRTLDEIERDIIGLSDQVDHRYRMPIVECPIYYNKESELSYPGIPAYFVDQLDHYGADSETFGRLVVEYGYAHAHQHKTAKKHLVIITHDGDVTEIECRDPEPE